MNKSKIIDLYRILRHASFKKFFNSILLVYSYYVSKLLHRPIHRGLPMSISIEPTTACNLRCPECPSGLRSFTRPTGNLRSDFFKSTIDQLYPTLNTLMFYFQGEPYINPEFLDMVAYAEQKNIYTITSTNGHFLTQQNVEKTIDSNLSRIIISIDGTTQDTYEQYRKEGDLHKVLEGTKLLVAEKKKRGVHHPHIIFQFLVVKPNEHQIPEVYRLATEIGVNEVRLKTAQVYDFENGNPLIPTIEKYSRYKSNPGGGFSIKNKLLNECWRMWSSCVITWDGRVVPCCFDKDAAHKLGDLKINRFQEIWSGETYHAFRSSLVQSRAQIDICKNCTEGGEVFA